MTVTMSSFFLIQFEKETKNIQVARY